MIHIVVKSTGFKKVMDVNLNLRSNTSSLCNPEQSS